MTSRVPTDVWLQAATATGVGLWGWDVATGRGEFSPGWKRLLGYAESELGDQISEWMDRIHPEDLSAFRAQVAAVLGTPGQTGRADHRIRCRDGAWRTFRAHVARDPQEPSRLFGNLLDITELAPAPPAARPDATGAATTPQQPRLAIVRDATDRTAADAALLESERAYRTLAENTPDMIIRWDRELRRVYVNPAFCAAVGLRADQVVGTALGSQYSASVASTNAAYLTHLAATLREVIDRGEARELVLPWVGIHGRRMVEHRLIAERGPTGEVATVLGIGRDITRLVETERDLRSLTDHVQDIIARVDLEARYRFVNRALEHFAGIEAPACIGRRLGELLTTTADGSVAPPYLTLRREVARVVADGQVSELELPLPHPGGDHLFNIRLIPERDESDAIASVLIVGRDITARRALETQLQHAQKLEAVGQLASGIAHDFNNVLAVILMQSEVLLADVGPGELHAGLDEILGAAEHAAALTRQLLTFSRREAATPVDLDMAEVIRGMTKLLRRVLSAAIAVDTRFAPSLPRVHADRGMLEQVLMNLAINARDAMPHGGRLTIELDQIRSRPPRTTSPAGEHAARHVVLAVRDTGTGIVADDVPRLFEPFFTTKAAGRGTGLGLATVASIVELHRGWIEVDSEVGRGTTFRVYLPATAS